MVLGILKKSFGKVRSGIGRIFSKPIDEEALEELEELFYQADLGVETSLELVEQVRKSMRKGLPTSEILTNIQSRLQELLDEHSRELKKAPSGPTVTLVLGVNGHGKTTSIAKLAHHFQKRGERVLLAASDTFRAAAIDQLQMWADRLDLPLVKHQMGSDPAAVAFDAVSAGVARGADRVLIDTAGRLHTKEDLMRELEKIQRVCQKVVPESPHETLLVMDATTGQNGLEQALVFHKYTPLTGVILTKMDGTARGGVVVPIQRKLGIPVKFIGVGEGSSDLQPFDSKEFVSALFS